MKKLILILALIAGFAGSSHDVYGQNWKEWNDGVEGLLGPTGTTTDSVRLVGTLPLRNTNRTKIDSAAVMVSYQDSARIALRVKMLDGFGIVRDTATVAQVGGDKIIDATAAGSTVYPWYAIREALGDKIYGAATLIIEVIIYKTGTEVRSSGKKYRVRAEVWS